MRSACRPISVTSTASTRSSTPRSRRFGAIDIVVNNAANVVTQPATGLTPDTWDKSYAVNLRGPVFLAKAAHPYLAASEHGRGTQRAVGGAPTYSPGMGMYTTAKAAMLAWTRNLAAEWVNDGIRVNVLAPGTTDTDMVRNNGPEAAQRMAEISLMRRAAHADEMVGPALSCAPTRRPRDRRARGGRRRLRGRGVNSQCSPASARPSAIIARSER